MARSTWISSNTDTFGVAASHPTSEDGTKWELPGNGVLGVSMNAGTRVDPSYRMDFGIPTYRGSTESPTYYAEDYAFLLRVPAVPPDPTIGRYKYRVGMNLSLSSGTGIWTANFGQTLELTKIRFEDGTTPEELGYTIEFDSGRLSPNVQANAVPEPSSMAIWILGLVGVAYRKLPLRRRMHRNIPVLAPVGSLITPGHNLTLH